MLDARDTAFLERLKQHALSVGFGKILIYVPVEFEIRHGQVQGYTFIRELPSVQLSDLASKKEVLL